MEVENEDKKEKYTFDDNFQDKILGHIFRDYSYMENAVGVINPTYFREESSEFLAKYALDYFKKFNQIPSPSIIKNDIKTLKDHGRISPALLDGVKDKLKLIYNPVFDLSNRDYMIAATSVFAKKVALEDAIIKSAKILDDGGDFEKVLKLIEKANQVGVTEHGVSYALFADVDKRIDSRFESLKKINSKGITTGIKLLDDNLYHKGWGRKEFSSLMGAPKAGKSIALAHFAINAAQDGNQVLYITLENSGEVTGDRMDANISNTPMVDIINHAKELRDSAANYAHKGGEVYVHEYAGHTLKPSMIKKLIHFYRTKGVLIDLVVLDYADLAIPDYDTGDKIENSKHTYVGLRKVAQEENIALLSATQTNRDGAKAQLAKATDISEDINKLRIVDALITIASTETEKTEDKFRLYFSAMRNGESGLIFSCESDKKRMKFIKKIEMGRL